mgnify:CR=1 FL=1
MTELNQVQRAVRICMRGESTADASTLWKLCPVSTLLNSIALLSIYTVAPTPYSANYGDAIVCGFEREATFAHLRHELHAKQAPTTYLERSTSRSRTQ